MAQTPTGSGETTVWVLIPTMTSDRMRHWHLLLYPLEWTLPSNVLYLGAKSCPCSSEAASPSFPDNQENSQLIWQFSIRRNYLTEFQQEHWVHICLSWQANSHQVHNVQVPENFDHIHNFLSTCLVGSFMKTRASLSRSSVPVLRVLVFTATCPQAFHLELFQNIDWQSHSEAMSQFKTFCSPQFSNLDWAWVCPCRPCHRLPCLGFGPCQASPRGRCSCAGTWTTCSCVFVELMELVLERNVKGMFFF